MKKGLLVMIDMQEHLTKPCPETTRRINAAVPQLRDKLTVLWVCTHWPQKSGWYTRLKPFKPHKPEQVGHRTISQLQAQFNRRNDLESDLTFEPAAEDWVVDKGFENALTNPYVEEFFIQQSPDDIFLGGFKTDVCAYQTAAAVVSANFKTSLFVDLSANHRDDFDDPAETKKLYKKIGADVVSAREYFGITY